MYEAVAGAVAGALQVIPACPVEAVKIRMQVAGEKGEKLTIPMVIQDLGFSGLVRGFDVTAFRDIAGGAVFFSIFASMKQFLNGYEWFHTVAIGAFLVKFLAGFVAAVPAAIIPTPFDVVKTRMQAEPKPGEEPYPDSLSCLKDLLQKEGPGALLYVRPRGAALSSSGPLPCVALPCAARPSPRAAPSLHLFPLQTSRVRRQHDVANPLALPVRPQGSGLRALRGGPALGITLALYEIIDDS